MRKSRSLVTSWALLTTLLLAGCAGSSEDSKSAFYKPDYRIKVAKTPQGYVAIAPECPDWSKIDEAYSDNNMPPTFGCATQRNLAAMIDKPEDLIKQPAAEPTIGIKGASSIDRYYSDRTIALMDPNSKTSEKQDVQSTGITSSNPMQ